MKQLQLFPTRLGSLDFGSSPSSEDSSPTSNTAPSPISLGSFITKSATATFSTFRRSYYYDIPLPQDATDTEVKICKYLEAHNVHVSSPEEKSQTHTAYARNPATGSPILFNNRKKSSLLERRNSLHAAPSINAETLKLNLNFLVAK